MAYDSTVTNNAYSEIRRLFGEEVKFDGRWWHKAANGHWQVVTSHGAATYSLILDAIAGEAALKTARARPPAPMPSGPSPSSSPAPAAPAAPPMSDADRTFYEDWASAARMQRRIQSQRSRGAPPPPPAPGGGDGGGGDEPDIFHSPFLYAARAFVPAHYRQYLRRGTNVLRGAQALEGEEGAPEGVAGLAAAGGVALLAAGIGIRLVKELVSAVSSKVHESADAGGKVVDILLGGVKAAGGEVWAAGTEIAGTLLKAATSGLGASGGAVQTFAGVASKSIHNLLGMAFEGVSKVANLGGQLLGGGVAVVGTLLLGIIGTAIGAVFMKMLSVVAEFGGKLLEGFGKIFGELGHIVGAGLEAIISIVTDVVGTRQGYAKAVLALSLASGMGTAQAGQTYANLKGLGLSPGDVSGLSQNLMMQRMYAPMLGGAGGPAGSAASILGMADTYQARSRTLMGRMMEQSLLKSAGMEGLEETLSKPHALLAGAMQRSDSMNAAFGMNPAAIVTSQNAFNSLIDSAKQFYELVKLKIADTLMPYLTGALDKAISYVGAHGEDISKWIVTGVETVIRWIVMLGNFLYNTLPNAIATGLSFMLKVGAYVAGALATGFQTLSDHIPQILGGLDALIDGIHEFAAIALGVGAALKEMWHGGAQGVALQKGIAKSAGGGYLMNQGGMLPDLDLGGWFSGSEVAAFSQGVLNSSPFDAFSTAYGKFNQGYVPSHLAKDYTKDAQQWLTGQGGAGDYAKAAQARMLELSKTIEQWRDGRAGNINIDAVLAELRNIAKGVYATADNTKSTSDQMAGHAENTARQAQSLVNQDRGNALLSLGTTDGTMF